MKRFITITLSILTISLPAFSQREIKNGVVIDHTAEKIVKNIVGKLKSESPMSFDFTFKVIDDGKTIQEEKGSFLSNGDKFKVQTDNFEDYSDGTNIWHFFKAENEVEVSNVDDGGSMFNFPNLISTYIKDFRPKLIRQQQQGNLTYNILDLNPTKKSNIMKARITAEKNTNRISEIILYTADNRTYTYTLANYKVKLKPSAADFVFPKEKFPQAQIIDLR
ncbi:MAG: outer membrane lipoprotein carrier protein LolA [Bacteroidales bacterium]|jgi:outer membrane lipoprotein-sorting protein|nr:outer membrane lipoprotein carrier protein LolA [Bacteroidales bacterium]